MFGRRYRASIATIVMLIVLNASIGAAAWFRSQCFDPAPSKTGGGLSLSVPAHGAVLDSGAFVKVAPDQDPVLVRPMFVPGRRQTQPPVVSVPVSAVPPAASAPPAFAVDGIVVRGDLKTAHIRMGPADAGQWVREGTTVADWMLKQVSVYDVTFAKGDQRLVVRLYPENGVRFERIGHAPVRSAP